MNTFVNNQTAGRQVAAKGSAMKMATGRKAGATGMGKIMGDHKKAQPVGGKYPSGGKCGVTK